MRPGAGALFRWRAPTAARQRTLPWKRRYTHVAGLHSPLAPVLVPFTLGANHEVVVVPLDLERFSIVLGQQLRTREKGGHRSLTNTQLRFRAGGVHPLDRTRLDASLHRYRVQCVSRAAGVIGECCVNQVNHIISHLRRSILRLKARSKSLHFFGIEVIDAVLECRMKVSPFVSADP